MHFKFSAVIFAVALLYASPAFGVDENDILPGRIFWAAPKYYEGAASGWVCHSALVPFSVLKSLDS